MAGNGVDLSRSGRSRQSGRSGKAADPATDRIEQEPANGTFHLDPGPADPAQVGAGPIEPAPARAARLGSTPGASPVNATLVYALLGFLVALDVVLATCALALPNTWFAVMHDRPYIDPAGLLRRTGAVWVAFLLLQAIALVRWRRAPYWLALIAGVRLTEIFSDLTTLAVADHVTWFARLTLPMATLTNLVVGWFLIVSYRRLVPGATPSDHDLGSTSS